MHLSSHLRAERSYHATNTDILIGKNFSSGDFQHEINKICSQNWHIWCKTHTHIAGETLIKWRIFDAMIIFHFLKIFKEKNLRNIAHFWHISCPRMSTVLPKPLSDIRKWSSLKCTYLIPNCLYGLTKLIFRIFMIKRPKKVSEIFSISCFVEEIQVFLVVIAHIPWRNGIMSKKIHGLFCSSGLAFDRGGYIPQGGF